MLAVSRILHDVWTSDRLRKATGFPGTTADISVDMRGYAVITVRIPDDPDGPRDRTHASRTVTPREFESNPGGLVRTLDKAIWDAAQELAEAERWYFYA